MDDNPNRWPDAIRRRDPRAVEALHRMLADMASARFQRRYELTRRELDVLQALADTGSTPGVARVLGIKVETVRKHVKNIHPKLGARNSAHAVALGIRQGMIE